MAQFTVYRSTDSGAPTLNGIAGSYITVLDAVLVNGYGSKSAAGWTRPFGDSTKAVYRMGGSIQFYFRVDDSLGIDARVRMFEAMTDVDTGNGAFPTVAQSTNGKAQHKSGSADSTARTWIIFADSRTFYVFVRSIGTTQYQANGAGEFYSLVTSDPYRAFNVFRDAEGGTPPTSDCLTQTQANQAALRWFVARGHTGTGGSVECGAHADWTKGGAASWYGAGGLAYPMSSDGGLYLANVWIHDPTTATPNVNLRGRARGLWAPCHPNTAFSSTFGDEDTFSGTGDLAGRTFIILKVVGSSGCIAIETSNTLETN